MLRQFSYQASKDCGAVHGGSRRAFALYVLELAWQISMPNTASIRKKVRVLSRVLLSLNIKYLHWIARQYSASTYSPS